MDTKTYEQKMKELKKDMSPEEILNSENDEIRSCNFSIGTIRNYTIYELKELRKEWNDMQIDILVQGVENSDWLKINFETEELSEEIREWISNLEEDWKETGEFGYKK